MMYTQVCPPGLHISLGIFFRLFTLLEDECHELDVRHSLQLQGSTAGSSFTTFLSAVQRQAKLRDDINRVTTQIGGLEQLLTLALVSLPQNTPQMTAFTEQLADEIRSRRKMNSEMVHRY